MQAATGVWATSSQQVHLLARLSRLMARLCQPRSSLLLQSRQGATIKHNLKLVQAGCQQMPSPHQMACFGQQYVTCRLRQGRGRPFYSRCTWAGRWQPSNCQESGHGRCTCWHQIPGVLMAAIGQPRSSPLLLGRQIATTKHNLKQVQAGFQQIPSPHQTACCGQQYVTCRLQQG